MAAVGIMGVMLVSLYAGFSSGFAVLRLARENLRATQILAERMEVIRLVRWDDVTPGFIPGTFTAPFEAGAPISAGAEQSGYRGTVTIIDAPVSESYAGSLRMVRIELTWKSGNIMRHREMATYVSRYGLQNYIY
jgi:hypothetical protein